MTDPPAAQKRILASQACDGCRLRKVRCKDGSPGSQCSRCVHLSLTCTFDMPTSARGPKRRKHTSSVSLQEISLNGRPAALLSPGSTASGEDGLLRPGSSTGDPPTSSISPTQTTGLSPNSPRYATDDLCPREIVLLMLEDYMNLLYPLIPVVHRPTFRRSIATNQDSHDSDFLGLIIAMCAVIVGNVPSRFETYRDHKPGYSLGSRKDFIHHAYSVLLSLRGPDYFDEISFQKFAIPYLFDIAFFQIGQVNRSRMIEAECLQLARMLGLHNITGYTGLNHIETQLRKKGFWLVFYSHVHHSVQSLLKERLTYLDPALLQQIDPEALMPLDVEDEAIFEDRVVPELSPQPNLTTGFNLANLVWWAAVESWGDPSTPGSARRPCTCSHFHDRRERAAHVQSRLQDLKYTLDAIPPELRQWALRPINPSPSASPRDQEILSTQYGAIRANLHVTHIWLRSILLDQLDSLAAETCPATSPAHLATVESRWAERENLAAQLIHLLHGIAPRAVEPNALHFAYKVRDVAVGLLGCPFEERDPASVRAAGYVRDFTQILSRLDASEVVMTTNLQTWVDTDREQGRRGR